MHEAALDTSEGTAFAIKKDNQILATHYRPHEPHSTQEQLEPWMRDILQDHELTFGAIARWSVGLGPGSFTGIRVGIAFLKGITLESAAQLQGVLTAYAVASQTSADLQTHDTLAVLNDARRGQIIVTEFCKEHSELSLHRESWIPRKDEFEYIAERCTRLVTIQAQAIKKIVPEKFRPKLVELSEIDAAYLFNAPETCIQHYAVNRKNLEPVYVRPPALVKPGKQKNLELGSDA